MSDDEFVSEHVPSGFCCLKVSIFDDEIYEPFVYSGPDVMRKFYDYIYDEQRIINEMLTVQKVMMPLTQSEQIEYENATICAN